MKNRYSIGEPVKNLTTYRTSVIDNEIGGPIGSGEALDFDGSILRARKIAEALNAFAFTGKDRSTNG